MAQGKPMTAQRMREIAAIFLQDVIKAKGTLRQVEGALNAMQRGQSIEVNGRGIGTAELVRIRDEATQEIALKQVVANELQEHSFTMKG